MLRNPWIFAGYDFEAVPEELFVSTCMQHLDFNREYYGDRWGCVTFRKFAKRYLSRRDIPEEQLRKLLTMEDPERFTAAFERMIRGESA